MDDRRDLAASLAAVIAFLFAACVCVYAFIKIVPLATAHPEYKVSAPIRQDDPGLQHPAH